LTPEEASAILNNVRLDDRTKEQVYLPVFVLFGLTFLLVAILLGKKMLERGEGSELPNWARPAVTRPKDYKPMPHALPPHKVKRIEPRKYRKRPSQTLRRPPIPKSD